MIKLYLFLILISNSFSMQDAKSIVIGKKINLYSKILSEEKELFISLPHKYDERIHSYPVIYVLEAEFLFEPAVTIAKMMAARSKMPQSIIVGLANRVYEKRHELGYKKWKGIPEKYIVFFKDELIPFIEKNYRVNSHRTVIALSPTNGFLIESFLERPDLFKGYIALSAHLEWDRIKEKTLIDELLVKSDDVAYSNVSLYLGRAESDFEGFVGSKEAFHDATEKLSKIDENYVRYKIDIINESEHYLMALTGIQNGFETIYPNRIWRNPGWFGWDKTVNYADDYYKNYYDDLTALYGFDIFPVEDSHASGFSIYGKAIAGSKFGTHKQVIDLLELGIRYYPKSAKMHRMLAEYYKKEDRVKEAQETAKKALQFAKQYYPDLVNEFDTSLKQINN